jgi:hypothetical protein
LLDRGVAAELPEQGCASERKRAADDGDDEELERMRREEAPAIHLLPL